MISASGYEIEIDSLKKEVAERALDYLKQVTHKSKINDVIDSVDYDSSTKPESSIVEDSKSVSFSVADELEKLSKLKNEQVISEEEFQMMKTDLFKKMSKQ